MDVIEPPTVEERAAIVEALEACPGEGPDVDLFALLGLIRLERELGVEEYRPRLLAATWCVEASMRHGPLAAQLQATAEALLTRAGGSVVEDLNEATDDPPDDSAFTERLAAARDAIARLAALSSSSPTPTAPPAIPSELGLSLAAMTESFRSLTETVKSQQQRIARVEKQFGLPNSAPSPERVRKAEPEEVGWPMDLNQRMDRESVDKAVSFHDL